MTAVAKTPYVEAQRDASMAAREALVRQFVTAGRRPEEAQRIVSNYVKESSARFERENANLLEDVTSEKP